MDREGKQVDPLVPVFTSVRVLMDGPETEERGEGRDQSSAEERPPRPSGDGHLDPKMGFPFTGEVGEPAESLSGLLHWLRSGTRFKAAYLALPNTTFRQYLQRRRFDRLPLAPPEAEDYILRRLASSDEGVLVIEGGEEGAPDFFSGIKTAVYPVPGRVVAGGCRRAECLFSRRALGVRKGFLCWETPFHSGDCCFKRDAGGERDPARCKECALLPVSVALVVQKEKWSREDVMLFMLACERCSLVMDDFFFQDLNERRQRMDSAVSRIAARMGEVTDFRQAMNHLLSTAMALLAADRGSIYVYEEQSGELRFAAWHNLPEDVDVNAPRRAESGIAAWVARHGKPLILQDRVEGEEYRGIDPQVRSAISYPLFHRGELFGVLNLGITDGKGRFCEADLHVLERLTAVGSMGMENAFLHRSMEEKEQLHRRLLAKIISAQEDERKRIASDIHDDTIQSLISCFYQLEAVEMLLEEEATGKALDLLKGIKRDLQRNITCMRRLLFDLRPSILDDAGLVPALEDYLNRMEEELGIRGFLYVDEKLNGLDSELGVSLYRMAQEIFNNIRKHARATEVEVKLHRRGRHLVLSVKDNGVGFDPRKILEGQGSDEHFGLRSLRERVELTGGEMEIISEPGKGTEVVIAVPAV